jgi:hypothetical protein
MKREVRKRRKEGRRTGEDGLEEGKGVAVGEHVVEQFGREEAMGLLSCLHRKSQHLREVVHRDGNDQVRNGVETVHALVASPHLPRHLADLLLRRLADRDEELLRPVLREHDRVDQVEAVGTLARVVEGAEVRHDGGFAELVLEGGDVRTTDVGEGLLVAEDLLDGLARVYDRPRLNGGGTALVVVLGDLEVLEDIGGGVRSGEGEEGVLRKGKGGSVSAKKEREVRTYG